MSPTSFYGAGFPNLDLENLAGKLIVVEGADSVGRTTQIELLRAWLEERGHAVSDTGLARSPLTSPGLDAAKQGHTLGRTTLSLFYATDFADLLENQILPALRAGFVVLSDRYFYSIVARDVVRGADPDWARKVYGFAPIPDLMFYLRADVETLAARILQGRGLNYWEAGMDIRAADNLYDGFVVYQRRLTEQFDVMAEEYGFVTVDATRSIRQVFHDLQRQIRALGLD